MAFSETIHSRSYTHIIRNVTQNPEVIFDDIVGNDKIVERADAVTKYYDELIEKVSLYNQYGEGKHEVNGQTVNVNLFELKKLLYLCIMSVNILEAIRFYVSFACSFAFAERELMEGNAKISNSSPAMRHYTYRALSIFSILCKKAKTTQKWRLLQLSATMKQ